ncbi:hypothetical protein IKQ26_05515 [bacterium]|nr:hypothetical protein [bacterium]
MKIFKYLLINLLIILILLTGAEIFIYKTNADSFKENNCNFFETAPFGYILGDPNIHRIQLNNYFTGENNVTTGRLPAGLEYKTEPATIFGCSFALGQFLENEQTFSYKLSRILKRPVYNRAVQGQGFQEMYYQSTLPEFYSDVPKSSDVIYVMIDDHYRRAYINTMSILDQYFLLHCKIKDGKIEIETYENNFMNFLKSLYMVKYTNLMYFEKYVNNDKNKDKITDDALLYFTKTRENLEAKWGKINFYVVFYGKIRFEDEFAKKLEDNGFKVIKTSDLTDADLENGEEYIIENNGHPSEGAWNLLTPKIAEIILKK